MKYKNIEVLKILKLFFKIIIKQTLNKFKIYRKSNNTKFTKNKHNLKYSKLKPKTSHHYEIFFNKISNIKL